MEYANVPDHFQDGTGIQHDEKVEHLQPGERREMTSKTMQLLNEIKRKVKSQITGQPEFKHVDQIIEAAVMQYYNALKREKHL